MHKTDEDIFTQAGIANEVGSEINQQVTDNRISKKLLRGEVTQEVRELAWRTYKVDRESRNFEYYSPTLAKRMTQERRDKIDSKRLYYENSENVKPITIQPNEPEVESISESMTRMVSNDVVPVTYTIEVLRDDMTRYRIEEYAKKVVVKPGTEEGHYILDIYVSKYPDKSDFKSKGFVREVEHIMNDGMRTDIFDINGISFVTSHAYGLNDGIRFVFNSIKYMRTVEFDGNYVIKLDAVLISEEDLIEQYRCEEMEAKYRDKAPKENAIAFDPYAPTEVRTFKCSKCGKVVEYNVAAMDAVIPVDPDDENAAKTNATEYMDMQMAEQTFGTKLCKECLSSEMEELYKKNGYRSNIYTEK